MDWRIGTFMAGAACSLAACVEGPSPTAHSVLVDPSQPPQLIRLPPYDQSGIKFDPASIADRTEMTTGRGHKVVSFSVLRQTKVDTTDPDAPALVTPLRRSSTMTVAASTTVRTLPAGCTAKPTSNDGETFLGQLRESAKTKFAPAAFDTQTYSIVGLRRHIPTDAAMQARNPRIKAGCDQDRVAEENRNVVVIGYLVAAAREDDNDYHLIVGDRDCNEPKCLITIEISGLPRTGVDVAIFRQARRQFEEGWIKTVRSNLPGRKYFFAEQRPLVRIKGSLFYDSPHKIDLETGKRGVGPEVANPNTAWELHPVSSIEFEPN